MAVPAKQQNSQLSFMAVPAKQQNSKFLSWGSDILGIEDYQNHLLAKNKPLKPVYVVVLDTGIDTDHEFLRGRIDIEDGKSFYTSTNNSSEYNFEDDVGHGTHVAGTIVDLTLDNVKIIPVKVLNSSGNGSKSSIMSGIEYAIFLKTDKKLNVVATNLSLSGKGETDQKMRDMIDNAYTNNILVVVAAGNSGYYAENEFPASAERALTISAFKQNALYKKFPVFAEYSNYGSNVDLCLPGSGILSCVPNECSYDVSLTSADGYNYSVLNGTSMATPHASALIALLATEMEDDFTAAKAESMLKENTYDFGERGKDGLFGYGIPYIVASIENESFEQPDLSFGQIGESVEFESAFTLNISYPQQQYCISYSLDGSIPTFDNLQAVNGSLYISSSTKIKMIVYKLDENSRPVDMSPLYEVQYLEKGHLNNDNGLGFTITSDGVVTSYSSGLDEIVLPQTINGIEVKKLAKNLFYGLSIKSFTCEFDIACDEFPFVSNSEMKYLYLGSKNAQKITKYCYALEELYLPKLTAILSSPTGKYSSFSFGYNGSETFWKSFNLKKVDLSSLRTVSAYAFSGYEKLQEVVLDWENLKNIEAYAFHYTKAYQESITTFSVKSIGESAFAESGIVGFVGKGVETLEGSVFQNCKNLISLQLPDVVNLGIWFISGADNLRILMLGPNISKIASFAFPTKSNMTVYCYDTGMEQISKFNVVSLAPKILKIDAPNLQVNLTGYDLRLEVYRSDDEILDQSDLLIQNQTFAGISMEINYVCDELYVGNYCYIFKIFDRYGNSALLPAQYSYEQKQQYHITFVSNVGQCGLITPKTFYYADEEVMIVNHGLDGYELKGVSIDGQPLTSENGRYCFNMPEHDVEINVEYSQIIYHITSRVEGEGAIKILDANGAEITEASYGMQVKVQYLPGDGYYLDSAYYMSSGLMVEISQKEFFTMPCCDIEVVAYFLYPKLKDFSFVSGGEGKIGLGSYQGNEEYIYIPQYYVLNGQRYRISFIDANCFFGKSNIKSISMEFEDDVRDIEIKNNAFFNCTSLERVSIGRITKVADSAFRNCQKLNSIDLSECEEIGSSAFYNCFAFVNLNLKSLKTLGEQVFIDCSGLEKVTGFKALNIPDKTFYGCSSLTSIDLSSTLSIGSEAFYGCGFQTINLASCKEFAAGGGQFQNCLSLSEVKNFSVEVVPKNAFAFCVSLSNIDLSKTKVIRTKAFDTCFELGRVDLSKVDVLEAGGISNDGSLRVYLRQNIKLLNENFPQVGYIYIDKNMSVASSYYVKEFNEFKVLTRVQAYIITFKFAVSEVPIIISQDVYNINDTIIVPKMYQDGYNTYTLQNWYMEGDILTLDPTDITTPSRDATYIVRKFTSQKNSYMLTYYYGYDFDNSGEVNDEGDIFIRLKAERGEKFVFPEQNPQREQSVEFEYVFQGWTIDGVLLDDNSIIEGDCSIIAKYLEAKRKYKVSWFDRDGRLIYSEDVEYGTVPSYDESHGLPRAYKDEAYLYTFAGWGDVHEVTGDVSYSPKYKQEAIIYRIYFYYGYDYDGNGVVGNDGDIFTFEEFNLNSQIFYPEFNHSYQKDGMQYDFQSWNRNYRGIYISDIADEFDDELKLKLYALYYETPVEYSVIWKDGNGDEIYKEKYQYGQTPTYKIDIYGTPKKDETNQYSYQFIGWEPEILPITGDTTFTAQFSEGIKSYRVTWLDGTGGIIYQEILEYGTTPLFNSQRYAFPTIDEIENCHYIFKKWDFEGVLVEDVKIKPIFDEINTIKHIDQTLDYVESKNLITSKVRIKTDELDRTKNLKVVIMYFELYINKNNIAALEDGTLDVTVRYINPFDMGKKYTFADGFIISLFINDVECEMVEPVRVILRNSRRVEKAILLSGLIGETFEKIDFEWTESALFFDISKTRCILIVREKTSYVWIAYVVTAVVVVTSAIVASIFVCKHLKKRRGYE